MPNFMLVSPNARFFTNLPSYTGSDKLSDGLWYKKRNLLKIVYQYPSGGDIKTVAGADWSLPLKAVIS